MLLYRGILLLLGALLFFAGYSLYHAGAFHTDGYYLWQTLANFSDGKWFDGGPLLPNHLERHTYWVLLLLIPFSWLWHSPAVMLLIASLAGVYGAWQVQDTIARSPGYGILYLLSVPVVFGIMGYDTALFQPDVLVVAFFPALWASLSARRVGQGALWILLCFAVKEECMLWTILLLLAHSSFSGYRPRRLWIIAGVLAVTNVLAVLLLQEGQLSHSFQLELLLRPRVLKHVLWVALSLLLPLLLLWRLRGIPKKLLLWSLGLILLRAILSTVIFGADMQMQYTPWYWGNTPVFVLLWLIWMQHLALHKAAIPVGLVGLVVAFFSFPSQVSPEKLQHFTLANTRLTSLPEMTVPAAVPQKAMALPYTQVGSRPTHRPYVHLRALWQEGTATRDLVLPQLGAILVHRDSLAWQQDIRSWGFRPLHLQPDAQWLWFIKKQKMFFLFGTNVPVWYVCNMECSFRY